MSHPHDVADLYLAPVLLAIDARIDELSRLTFEQLEERVGLESDRPNWTRTQRELGLLETICHLLDCHSWQLSWDKRGVRVTHGGNSVVLGIPTTFVRYLESA